MTKVKELPPERGGVSPEQLEKIGRYTRRDFAPDEVYAFSLILCDNEVDRDGERFDDEALEALAELFKGKTGVFDHAANAKNQSARIFDTTVEDAGQTASTGEPLRRLRAWAYMVRCDKNADLILEIDAGIKKEVSVGCAVEQVLCSVCGEDQKRAVCGHEKGNVYGGAACHHILHGPSDAYEWSFVAVPSQKNAGVTKRCGAAAAGPDSLQKLFGGQGEITLSARRRGLLAAEYERDKAYIAAGRAYAKSLRRDVVRLTLLTRPELDPTAMEQVAGKMDVAQLEAFQKAFAAGLEERFPTPQLAGPAEARHSQAEFKV